MNKFKHMTFLCMQRLTNFPYIEEDFDALTNYELLCKVVEYLNKVIENENNQNDAINELAEAFNNLKSYVEEYFDNLDVQEEINNKLDEMAESGQLTDIIAQYLGLAGMITFNTVAEMKEATNLVNGSKCATLGYHEINDGGNSFYKVRTITNDDVVDEALIIELADDSLIAELITNEINPIQCGCYGDGTHDDTANFQKAANSGKAINLLSKTYLISSTITLNNFTQMTGNGTLSTKIKSTINNGSPIFQMTGTIQHFKIGNFYVDGQNNNCIGFDFSNPYDDCIFENIHFALLDNTAIKCGNSSTISQSLVISNCFIYGSDENNNNPLISLEKCYETNLNNSKLLFRSGHRGTAACLYCKNTYDLTAIGNSFAFTSNFAILFDGESRYNRLVGNTYEDITNAEGIIHFNGTNNDDGQYNIVIESPYYNTEEIVKCTNTTGTIAIGVKCDGGRRNFAISSQTLMNEPYTNNYFYNDGRYTYTKGFGFTNYLDERRFQLYCEDSQYGDNGLHIKDLKTNTDVKFKPKAMDVGYNGYRIGLSSPDGSVKKYIGIDNNGDLTLYDNTV